MTGRVSIRIHQNGKNGWEQMTDAEVTLGEMLKGENYATAYIAKWDSNHGDDCQRGFPDKTAETARAPSWRNNACDLDAIWLGNRELSLDDIRDQDSRLVDSSVAFDSRARPACHSRASSARLGVCCMSHQPLVDRGRHEVRRRRRGGNGLADDH
jgi:arylsulfatase A-like enzyme